ncbi:1-(5-phosphoribosyl)-5-[(5-phosphoribosylamino)methylideneamino]imidazole-4-carboxamide isomerase [Methanocaldococcus indicus]|uniref:1-(5-phosphoribosyl)-5-[(5- phosphoribosylamino)methylideneamino]imidazole-4- carboxamide isomerase n=1 Tax=Methanocaldococcus indicus TaxID=213231 RepID=UPI003C6CF6FF
MLIIPAIDIKDKKCVQLVQGNPNNKILELDNPVEVAKKFVNEGAKYLHVIDLDGALGTGDNLDIIEEIVKNVNVPIEVGGGIRDLEKAKKLIDLGVDRVIVGTKAILNKKFLEELVDEFGKDRVVLAVESKNNKVVIKGWKEKIDKSPLEIIKEYEDLLKYILFTNVDTEGLMRGINLDVIKDVVTNTKLNIIYSGGVSSIEDIKNLKRIGVYGVVIGSAIYKGKISLKEAISLI